jgi:UDP-N-acetylmuramoyl-L-alanyl-D-glutamate--2,6-diaminopimelate ligase
MSRSRGHAGTPPAARSPPQRGGSRAQVVADVGAAARLAGLLEAAEPRDPRPLADLAARLHRAGSLRGIVPPGGTGGPGETGADGGRDVVAGPITAGSLGGVLVHGIAYDSRRVIPGTVFVAVPGMHDDGHAHAADAVGRGAAAVIVERPVVGIDVPQLVVGSSQRALAPCACWWYEDPSRALAVVGVTGTDGKTSTSRLLVAALEAAGIHTGMSTTAIVRIGATEVPNPVHATTPEAPEVQRLLRSMTRAGDRCAVIETTSHGLALERVGGVAYDAAIFTNLTHEHLEFHGSFEAYRAAKLRLFEALAVSDENPRKGPGGVTGPGAWPKTAVVNADDPAAPHVLRAANAAGARVVTYGERPGVDVRAIRIEQGATGLTADLDTPDGSRRMRLGLLGRFSVWNALAVLALVEGVGLDLDAALAGVASAPPVPGRMERVERGQPFTVVVDFAHSPASLRLVLDELRPVAAAAGGGLIAVFGSAGERDVAKRPMMGRVAGERCRAVVLADEDPRGEDPMAILEQIAAGAEVAGLRRGSSLHLELDRRAAIALAFRLARPGDVVVLAGKGHETEIIGRDGPVPWDERAVAGEELDRLQA